MTNFTRAALVVLSLSSACATTRSSRTASNAANNSAANSNVASATSASAQPDTSASNSTAVRVLGDVPVEATIGAPNAAAPQLIPGTIGQIPVGGTVQGSLVAGDSMLADGSYGDSYALSLTAGQPVTIVVRGGARSDINETMDVYAALFLGDAEIVHNDDITPENLDSRIVLTPPRTAVYRLLVTTFGSGPKPGAYTVIVAAGANPNAT